MARLAQEEFAAIPPESSAQPEAASLSASEAQSLLRMLLPKAEYDRSYSSVMLLPPVDGTQLYMRTL